MHAAAASLLERLASEYDVVATSEFVPTPDMTSFAHARQPATLTPRSPTAAPVSVAFTTFPGLVVRFGYWTATRFPVCGCDACAPSADDEYAKLEQMVRDVVSGHFEEELRVPLIGDARIRWSFGQRASGGQFSSSEHVLPRSHARALRADRPTSVRWQPWTMRRDARPNDLV
jgi:hypothetical protein